MDGATDEARQAIELKILSPSAEVGAGGLHFDHIPVSTTVGELKEKIRDVISTRPPNERQRLIYRGRALARETDTLLSVFGAAVIQEQQLHTLHLVLREGNPGLSPSPATARSSSVPPRNSDSSPSPLRAPPQGQQQAQSSGPTPSPRNPFRTPQAPQQPPVQQPQPQPIPNPLSQILQNANIRATANGVPVDLPPEMLNQLLNQHFRQHGQVPNLFAAIQQQQNPQQRPSTVGLQQRLHHLQHVREQIPVEEEQQRQDFDNQIAHLQQQIAEQEREASERRDSGEGSQGIETPPPQSHQPSQESQDGSRADEHSNRESATNGPASSAPHVQETPPAGSEESPNENAPQQPNVPNQPHITARSGVNPDGSRWSFNMTTTTVNDPNGHPHHPHHHHHPPPGMPMFAPPQMPQQQFPGMPPFAQLPFGQQMPFPFMQPPGGVPARMATPPAGGLRPGGTPRSVSPARSISEGQRRVGTPAAELQNRLESTRREIENVNRLLGVMSTGNMASGSVAPPLSAENRQELQRYSASMVSHIDGFGADLQNLANALHPNVRLQPDFVALQQLYQSVHAQGRAIQHQVQNMASNNPQMQSLRGGGRDSSPMRSSNTAPSSSRPPPTSHPSDSSTHIVTAIAPTPPSTAANTGTNLVVPDTVPSTAPTPELHLLTDPSGTPQALVVGPTGQYATSLLPPEILYGLLAAQLPHDQLLQTVNAIMREVLNPPSLHTFGIGLPQPPINHANIAAGFVPPPPPQQAPLQPQGRLQRLADRLNQRQQPQGNQPAIAGHLAVPGEQAGPAAAVAANAQNQARDILGPLMQNIWIIIRVAIFVYFFGSGRGYWRIVILGAAGIVIYALNSGWFAQHTEGLWERVRHHFEGLINLPQPQQQPQALVTGDGQGNGEGPSGGVAPHPQDAARRLVERQQGRNRAWVRDRARDVERTVALFFASLWPGVGEGLIQAQERARAEEQRRRDEEEVRRKAAEEEAEAKKESEEEKEKAEVENGGKDGGSEVLRSVGGESAATGLDSSGVGGLNRVNKGKAKASEEEVVKQENAGGS
ncbi:hypothetical protein EJ08DRAFT_678246 [Tothia fuscella]|uniref:Ubiquitin-like domain-containing protein n=1 Tax=Tothia fuscella TaxID=1048955 RepID=A0A9P4NTS5_9PEZI|nr:hypothetical protein EJ08DRAFT_678246 [Tothia fuscella]